MTKKPGIQNDPRPLVWMASYPKSGNTWLRIFLSNFLRDLDKPASINDLEKMSIASARGPLEQLYSLDSGDLTLEEIDQRRPEMYDAWANLSEEIHYHKVHDAYTFLPDGRPLLGDPKKQKAIYLVRNPLDVVASYANHNGSEDLDHTIECLANEKYVMAQRNTKKYPSQLRQKLLSWSSHVNSWLDHADMPIHVVRYEDMLLKTYSTFQGIIQFLNLPDDQARIEKAIRFSEMKELQRQEEKDNFKEKASCTKRFFRAGESGNWRDELTVEMVERAASTQGHVMEKLGYEASLNALLKVLAAKI